MNNSRLRKFLVAWLPVAVVATVPAETSHAMMQEVTRGGVDDVPRALAQRVADNLSRDGTAPAVTTERLVDLATDLGPFPTMCGADGAVS